MYLENFIQRERRIISHYYLTRHQRNISYQNASVERQRRERLSEDNRSRDRRGIYNATYIPEERISLRSKLVEVKQERA